MYKLCLPAVAIAVLLATPAFAEDDFGLSDAISPTVLAKEKQAPATPAVQPDNDRGTSGKGNPQAEKPHGKSIKLDETPVQPDPYHFSADQQPAGKSDKAPATAPANTLGPLWGVPQDSPVMQNLDPEMEKQYAVNGEGRLVPTPTADELKDQQKAAAKAQRDKEKAQAKAERDQRRADEKAQEEERRAAEKASKADKSSQKHEADSAPGNAPAETVQDAPAKADKAEQADDSHALRTTAQQEGW